jgi:hypothetical protein
MPYIPQSDRPQYDPHIDSLARLLAAQPAEKRKGHANYVITQILRHAWVPTREAESYSNYADVVGTLECAKLEIYRRWVAPYEDRAIEKNADLG